MDRERCGRHQPAVESRPCDDPALVQQSLRQSRDIVNGADRGHACPSQFRALLSFGRMWLHKRQACQSRPSVVVPKFALVLIWRSTANFGTETTLGFNRLLVSLFDSGIRWEYDIEM